MPLYFFFILIYLIRYLTSMFTLVKKNLIYIDNKKTLENEKI